MGLDFRDVLPQCVLKGIVRVYADSNDDEIIFWFGREGDVIVSMRSYVENKTKMNWIILIIAGLFEVGFTTCLGKAKAATGMDAFWWYGGFVVSLTLSMLLLIKATQTIPLGTGYAVWTGIGAVGTAIIGILIFKDPATFWRLFFMTTLIASIVGLKMVSH